MKNSKCKNILISIGIWLMVVTILVSVVVGAGYGLYLIVDAADKNQPIIDVVTVDKGDVLDKYDIDILKSDVINNKSIEKNYYRIYSSDDPIDNFLDTDVDLKSIEPFEIDNAEIYSYSYFTSYNDDEPVPPSKLSDENGKTVEITPVLDDILDAIENVKHDKINMKIFNDNNDYYVYLELNTNWWYPCELYHYDKDSKSLDLIYQFDGEEIVGIKKIR
ncbi:MAG TPA: hypothetical protein OIL97_09475 [Oscillospiraceae bacterium]|jgi:hypothetical protein|nr:hypothetical protein [Ruminococcus sp.]MEE0006536.1 hypothetical protein [Ruminococcus sp.]HJI49737.1 hypothetical protein [Oscillospiraceae bacterium]